MEDFLYSSARIRALENGICSKERLERLMESGSLDRAISLLAEYGIPLEKDKSTGAFSRENTLEARLKTAYAEVRASAKEEGFLELWRYPYDCNNIKAAIKCAHRCIDADEMMFDFGSISPKTVTKAVFEKRFEELGIFADAAKEASDAFATSGNPQSVDLILDIACYRRMSEKAEESGISYVIDLVKKKIDLTNIMMCVRLLRMGNPGAGKLLLSNAFLPGGTLEKKNLTELFEAGESALWEKLSFSEYQKLAKNGGAGMSLTAIERAADNSFLEEVAKAKFIPYGAEPLVAYLLKAENEVRNLRIILAGLEAKLPVKTVKERVRYGDV